MIGGKKGPSLEFLRLYCDKFDENIIFNLNLSGKHLDSTGEIDALQKLFILNLSRNQLTSVDGLKGMKELAFLNISYNAVQDLSPLSTCDALVRIEALANKVAEVGALKSLGKLENLKVLTLQTLKREEANPVCSDPSYRSTVIRMIPSLVRLDFTPKAIELEIPKFDEESKIDLSHLTLTKGELYGDFSVIEKSITDSKKAEIQAENMLQKVDDARRQCRQKQEQADNALRDLERMVGNS